MRAVALALAVALVVAGCGVYSVRLDPPPEPLAAPAAPLDLTVSLGDVASSVDGRRVEIDDATRAAIDADFVRAGTAAGLFRAVLPHGSTTDVYVDVHRDVNAAPMTAARGAYFILVAPLAFLVPGFPHPWDYRVVRTVRLRGEVEGTSIPLPGRELAYDERVWGANYWGGLAADPLREREGEYLVAAVARTVDADPGLFTRFADAARAGDVEAAWLVGEQATSSPRF